MSKMKHNTQLNRAMLAGNVMHLLICEQSLAGTGQPAFTVEAVTKEGPNIHLEVFDDFAEACARSSEITHAKCSLVVVLQPPGRTSLDRYEDRVA